MNALRIWFLGTIAGRKVCQSPLKVFAIGSGGITFFIWLVPMSKEFAFAIERAVTVMVITCPHTLGLAVPLVVAVSTALAASSGLLIRNRGAFEAARQKL